MTASRTKGTNAENAVVCFLRNYWPWAERRALAGKKDRGDVAGIPDVVIECKAARTMQLGAWLRELDGEIVNAHASTGALFVKPVGKTRGEDYFVVMRPHHWAALMKEAGR